MMSIENRVTLWAAIGMAGLLPACGAATPASVSSSTPAPNGSAQAAVVQPPPTATAPSPLSNDEIKTLALASRDWTRITPSALAKNELCAPAGPMAVKGSHPDHVGEMFHLYMPANVDAFTQGKPMAEGAVVVKRSFKGAIESIDTGTTAYFIMYKRAGQNPTGGDWLYATTKPDGDVIRSGALADCAGCHDKQAAADYLFRKY